MCTGANRIMEFDLVNNIEVKLTIMQMPSGELVVHEVHTIRL